MNIYDLSRAWFDFSFEKTEAKVQHTALFMWCLELNNRLGWKKEFGLPTNDTMEGLSIGNKGTYHQALKDLQEWGFITIVKESKNQYQSCIIKINEKCRVKKATALDSALIQHSTQHSSSIGVGIVPIDIPINKLTNKPINKGVKFNFENIEWFKDPLVNKEFIEFIKNRIELKKPPTQRSLELIVKRARDNFKSSKEVIEAIHNSIASGWSDLYPLKPTQNKVYQQKTYSRSDHGLHFK
jgi:hypothetical protein